jgi:CHAD domain-containing protein
MAKAAEIDVTADEPYAHAAARVVRVRTQELFEYDEGVLDTVDIERVHDMRVATRRLRAVLEVFAPCFPKGPYKAALRDVKSLADALGERRDPDVHLEAMRARRGIEPLVARLRERQAAGNQVLAAALEAAEASDLRGRLLALADAAEERIAA